MAGVLVIGSLIVDMVITAPHLPEPGENVHGTGFAMVPGGKGANQAVAASRLGEDARLMGCVGADAFGDFLVESLAPDGVDSTLVKRSQDVPTGVALIAIEEGTGMNTIVVDPGANMALTVEDLDAVEPFYDMVGIALFQLEIPLDVVAEGARRAHDHGLVTVLDAGPPRDADLDLLAAFDVVSPNARELADLAGREVRDIKSAVRQRGYEPVVPTASVRADSATAVRQDKAVPLTAPTPAPAPLAATPEATPGPADLAGNKQKGQAASDKI